MDSARVGTGELIAGAAGLALLLVMFLPWFGVDASFTLPGASEPVTVADRSLNAWESLSGEDVLLAATALLALSLLVVPARVRPTLALVVIAAAALSALAIVLRLIYPPTIPVAEVVGTVFETGRRLGAFLGLVATAAIALGANRTATAAPAPPVGAPALPESGPAAPAPSGTRRATQPPKAAAPAKLAPTAAPEPQATPTAQASAPPPKPPAAPAEPAAEPKPAHPTPPPAAPAKPAPAAPEPDPKPAQPAPPPAKPTPAAANPAPAASGESEAARPSASPAKPCAPSAKRSPLSADREAPLGIPASAPAARAKGRPASPSMRPAPQPAPKPAPSPSTRVEPTGSPAAPGGSSPSSHARAPIQEAAPTPDKLPGAASPKQPPSREPTPTAVAPATPRAAEDPARLGAAPDPPTRGTPPVAASPLARWSREAIEARCARPWRAYDRRLGQRYARYFERHPELRGEQRFSARDIESALPTGWGDLADVVPEGAWDRNHLSGKSTQTLALGLLGVAARRMPSLEWLTDALVLPHADAPRIKFERALAPTLLNERPRQTSIDVLVEHPEATICIEATWREAGIDGCACRGTGVGPLAGRCSRAVEERNGYWSTAADLLGLPPRDRDGPCPISPSYRAVRTAAAARALSRPGRLGVLALVYDAENPYFAGVGDWPGWPAVLKAAIAANADPDRFRFAAISWQELLPRLPLDDQTRTWAAQKHGLG